MPDHTNPPIPPTFPLPIPYPTGYLGYRGCYLPVSQPYPLHFPSAAQQDDRGDKEEPASQEQGLEYRDGMAFMPDEEEGPAQGVSRPDAYGMMPLPSAFPYESFQDMPAYGYQQPVPTMPDAASQPATNPSGPLSISPMSFELHPYSEMRVDRLVLPQDTVAVSVAMLRVRNLMAWKVPVDILGNFVKVETPNGHPIPMTVELIPTDPTFVQVFAKPGTEGKAIDRSLIPSRDHVVACVTAISGSNAYMNAVRFRISCTAKGIMTVSLDLRKMREMIGLTAPGKSTGDASENPDGNKGSKASKDSCPPEGTSNEAPAVGMGGAGHEESGAKGNAERRKAESNKGASADADGRKEQQASDGETSEGDSAVTPAPKMGDGQPKGEPTETPGGSGNETGPVYRATVIPQYNPNFVPPTRPIQPPLLGAKIPQGTPWTDAVAAAFDAVTRDTIPNITGDVTFLDETPKILRDIGFPNLPWVHDRAHLAREAMRKMNREDPDGHGVYRELLDGLSAWLLAPVAVFEPITHIGCVDILLDAIDQFGAPFIACCGLDITYPNHQPRVHAIRIISIHSRDGIVKMLEEATEQGRMIAVSKRRLKALTERWDVRGGRPTKTLRPKAAHGGQLPETWQMALASQADKESRIPTPKAGNGARGGSGKAGDGGTGIGTRAKAGNRGRGTGNQASSRSDRQKTPDDGTRVRAFLRADRAAKVADKARREAERQAKAGTASTSTGARQGRAVRNASQQNCRQGSGTRTGQQAQPGSRKGDGRQPGGNGKVGNRSGNQPVVGPRSSQRQGGKGSRSKPVAAEVSDGWRTPLMDAMEASDQKERKRQKQERKRQRRAERKAEKRARQQQEAAASKDRQPAGVSHPANAQTDGAGAKVGTRQAGGKAVPVSADIHDVLTAVTTAIGAGGMVGKSNPAGGTIPSAAKGSNGASITDTPVRPGQTRQRSTRQERSDGQRVGRDGARTGTRNADRELVAKDGTSQSMDARMGQDGTPKQASPSTNAHEANHGSSSKPSSGTEGGKVSSKEQTNDGTSMWADADKVSNRGSKSRTDAKVAPNPRSETTRGLEAKAKAKAKAKAASEVKATDQSSEALVAMRPVRKKKATRRRPGDKGRGVPEGQRH